MSRRWRADKALLGFMGLTTFGFGCAYMLDPLHWAAASGLTTLRPVAMAELRGYYAGLQMGMGVLFFLGLRDPSWIQTGLRAAAVLFAGNALGRVVGAVGVHAIDSYNLSGLIFEFGFSGASLWLLRHPPKQEHE